MHHPEPKHRFEIETATEEGTDIKYPVVRLTNNFIIFPTFDQLYALRATLDQYLNELAVNQGVADAIR
jgi:hypothetical protein